MTAAYVPVDQVLDAQPDPPLITSRNYVYRGRKRKLAADLVKINAAIMAEREERSPHEVSRAGWTHFEFGHAKEKPRTPKAAS